MYRYLLQHPNMLALPEASTSDKGSKSVHAPAAPVRPVAHGLLTRSRHDGAGSAHAPSGACHAAHRPTAYGNKEIRFFDTRKYKADRAAYLAYFPTLPAAVHAQRLPAQLLSRGGTSQAACAGCERERHLNTPRPRAQPVHGLSPRNLITGESSPGYIYHPLVAERVANTVPRVKVRNRNCCQERHRSRGHG